MTRVRCPAVLVHRHGGPEVLEFTEIDVAAPGPGELRIVQQAIGLNFADVYQRQGAHGPHSTTQFPVVLGSQGAGRALGAEVIGTVGSAAKREVALAHGCHHVINYREEDFVVRVREITESEGVAVVYDAVGHDVFVPSLDCLRVRGMAINYGTASGDVQAFDLQRLHAKSLTVCRPTLRSFTGTPAELRLSAETYAAAVRSGAVLPEVSRSYALCEVQRAHRTGKPPDHRRGHPRALSTLTDHIR